MFHNTIKHLAAISVGVGIAMVIDKVVSLGPVSLIIVGAIVGWGLRRLADWSSR